jgi:hypothetical protein
MVKNICFQSVRVEDLQNVRTQKLWSAKEFCRITGHGVKHNSANFGQVFTAHGIYGCSGSWRRAEEVDKRMVLVHTHGLFIT